MLNYGDKSSFMSSAGKKDKFLGTGETICAMENNMSGWFRV